MFGSQASLQKHFCFFLQGNEQFTKRDSQNAARKLYPFQLGFQGIIYKEVLLLT
jgi:hypothetical protein